MSADSQLEIAGLAAERLEQKGFVSVARLRDGVVTLEWWTKVGGKQLHMRRRVTDADASPDELAEVCASELRAALAPGSAS
jgi:hypothetical protein